MEPEAIKGGITNVNFLVRDGDGKFFVRIGNDIPVHGVMRFNEIAANKAAERAGISPALVYSAPGVLVTRFIDAKTLGPEDLCDSTRLEAIVEIISRCHREMPKHLRGPALIFWVFHVLRDYAASLREGESRSQSLLPELMTYAQRLETIVGAINIVYGHNDLLAANFLDDGERLWLVDWDYGGFNSPLFDLANLSSNNEYPASLEERLLETYFERQIDDELRRRYGAMKCASLLREAMWSMVSEIHSDLDVDYRAYTQENLVRFERAYADFTKNFE